MEIRNILITSAGRRVTLVNIFRKTLKKYNKNGKVYTTDMNPFLSSACHISDGYFKVPKVTDRDYLKILKEICIENNISIVIPTIDTELHILASAKDDFLRNNILIAVSSEELCKTFYFKTSTEKFFKKYGFKTPEIIKDLNNCFYPIFAKKNNSSSSIGARIINSFDEAKNLLKYEDYIFQEYINGEEYTVDVFIDRNQNVIAIIPRLRIEVRAGEVSKAKTVKDKKIIEKIKEVCKLLKGAYACLTIQLFKKENDIFFIEINPRFGGGYPLSYFAGANFAEYLIQDYLQYELIYNEEWKNNLIMLRYDAEVIVDGNSF